MKSHLPENDKTVQGNLQMNLYDLNKQIISQMPVLDADGLERAVRIINDYVGDTEQTFYMLLCRDINYYTLFHRVNTLIEPDVGSSVLECTTDIGAIKSVEETGDGAIEIWVEPSEDNTEPVAMYLFGYDMGVVECTL